MPDSLHKRGILYFNVKNQYNSVLYLSISGRDYCWFIKVRTITTHHISPHINNGITHIRTVLNVQIPFYQCITKSYFFDNSRLKSSWFSHFKRSSLVISSVCIFVRMQHTHSQYSYSEVTRIISWILVTPCKTFKIPERRRSRKPFLSAASFISIALPSSIMMREISGLTFITS